ncbi:hypothetical protein [Bradyrhizobium liaoningense]|nr:hypothetical protein [Bradyrhizobium liaoningense]
MPDSQRFSSLDQQVMAIVLRGELGGIGGDHTMWAVRGKLNKSF